MPRWCHRNTENVCHVIKTKKISTCNEENGVGFSNNNNFQDVCTLSISSHRKVNLEIYWYFHRERTFIAELSAKKKSIRKLSLMVTVARKVKTYGPQGLFALSLYLYSNMCMCIYKFICWMCHNSFNTAKDTLQDSGSIGGHFSEINRYWICDMLYRSFNLKLNEEPVSRPFNAKYRLLRFFFLPNWFKYKIKMVHFYW